VADRERRRKDAAPLQSQDEASVTRFKEAEATDPNNSGPRSPSDGRLEVWMTLEEAAEVTGLTQDVLNDWDMTGKIASRVVPSANGGRKEVLLADVMRRAWTAPDIQKSEVRERVPQLDLHSENEMLRHEIERLGNERELAERRADLARAIAAERQKRMEDAEREIERTRAERAELLHEIEGMTTERQQHTGELRRRVVQREELRKELDRLSAEQQDLMEELLRRNADRQGLIADLELSRAGEERMARDVEQSDAELIQALMREKEAKETAKEMQRGFEEIKRVADLYLGSTDQDEA
jgi:hypothetical protein